MENKQLKAPAKLIEIHTPDMANRIWRQGSCVIRRGFEFEYMGETLCHQLPARSASWEASQKK